MHSLADGLVEHHVVVLARQRNAHRQLPFALQLLHLFPQQHLRLVLNAQIQHHHGALRARGERLPKPAERRDACKRTGIDDSTKQPVKCK